MTESEPSITRALVAYKSAVLARDVDAFIDLYSDDVRVFDTWGVWAYEGHVSFRAMVAAWFGSLGTERVNVSFDEVQIILAHDTAVVSAFATFQALSEGGGQLRSMNNRLTWAMKMENDSWKIFHEHTSVPGDIDTMKMITRRS